MPIKGTNSLVNLIYGNRKQPKPKVGHAATILCWTDRSPCTIVEVSRNGKQVTVQEDGWKLKPGKTAYNRETTADDYEYTPNPNAPRTRYTLRKNGLWVREGEDGRNGTKLRIGVREQYCDPCF